MHYMSDHILLGAGVSSILASELIISKIDANAHLRQPRAPPLPGYLLQAGESPAVCLMHSLA